MPKVAFDRLPDDARVWVFAADRAVTDAHAETLLAEVDAFLDTWNAHGHALQCGRAWRDDRFLAVAVDQSTAGASGCSIDGLFRTLQRLQPAIGASLLPGGRVYWRDARGDVAMGTRAAFAELGRTGGVNSTTPVFDTAITTMHDWRKSFERPAASSWHGEIIGQASRA